MSSPEEFFLVTFFQKKKKKKKGEEQQRFPNLPTGPALQPGGGSRKDKKGVSG
jgi:hypothetical protein